MARDELNQQIEKVLDSNIDKMEMEAIQREISRYRDIERDHLNLQQEHKELKEQCCLLGEKLQTAQATAETLKEGIGDLVNREAALKIREAEMSVKEQIHDIKIECAEQRVDDHKNMVGLVFRSPVYKETITRNGSKDVVVPIPMSDSGMTGVNEQRHLLESETTETKHEEE